MAQLLIGVGFIMFGLVVGGVGVASAGVGIGVPMIPIGIYIAYRGGRLVQHEKQNKETGRSDAPPPEQFEKTRSGRTGLGIILFLVGLGTSAFIIGIPIALAGVWLIYSTWQNEIKALLGIQNQPED